MLSVTTAEAIEPRVAEAATVGRTEPPPIDSAPEASGLVVEEAGEGAGEPIRQESTIALTDIDSTPPPSCPEDGGAGPDTGRHLESTDRGGDEPSPPPAVQPVASSPAETSEPTEIIIEASLEDLASSIRRSHRRVLKANGEALFHAKEAGDALTLARSQVKHGAWGEWVAEAGLNPRTERLYRYIAEGWARLEELVEAKRQSIADLTINGAARLLAKPRIVEGGLVNGDRAEVGAGGDGIPLALPGPSRGMTGSDHVALPPPAEAGSDEADDGPREEPGDGHVESGSSGRSTASQEGELPAQAAGVDVQASTDSGSHEEAKTKGPNASDVGETDQAEDAEVKGEPHRTSSPGSETGTGLRRRSRTNRSSGLQILREEAKDAVGAFLGNVYTEAPQFWARKAAEEGISLEELVAKEVVESVLELIAPLLVETDS